MLDRRQEEPATVDDIARAKIDAIQVRDGDPSREAVLRAVLAELQTQFKANSKTASVVPDEVSTQQATSETQAPANSEASEKLNDVERACLESMKADFYHGIVLIDDNAARNAYQAALEQDKTAGQSWETVQGRLLANEESLLKEAVELSKLTGDQEGKGAYLVGVYKNGKPAIRQRSPEIVNAIVNKKGKLRLAFHPEAQLEEGEQWANAVEIVRAVKAAGYHVPAGAGSKGLVAAYEMVINPTPYVASPNRDEGRVAMLDCPDEVPVNACVRAVNYNPWNGYTNLSKEIASLRDVYRGAVLWLRG